MSPHDFAQELLSKAGDDEYTVDKLIDDPAVDDAIIGFHCQQAAEKLLKAVLVERGQYFKKSHNCRARCSKRLPAPPFTSTSRS